MEWFKVRKAAEYSNSFRKAVKVVRHSEMGEIFVNGHQRGVSSDVRVEDDR